MGHSAIVDSRFDPQVRHITLRKMPRFRRPVCIWGAPLSFLLWSSENRATQLIGTLKSYRLNSATLPIVEWRLTVDLRLDLAVRSRGGRDPAQPNRDLPEPRNTATYTSYKETKSNHTGRALLYTISDLERIALLSHCNINATSLSRE